MNAPVVPTTRRPQTLAERIAARRQPERKPEQPVPVWLQRARDGIQLPRGIERSSGR